MFERVPDGVDEYERYDDEREQCGREAAGRETERHRLVDRGGRRGRNGGQTLAVGGREMLVRAS